MDTLINKVIKYSATAKLCKMGGVKIVSLFKVFKHCFIHTQLTTKLKIVLTLWSKRLVIAFYKVVHRYSLFDNLGKYLTFSITNISIEVQTFTFIKQMACIICLHTTHYKQELSYYKLIN